ncbi:MAG: septum formation initiator family protein [Deltaproteobacteria bacterium]|nr:septum formation initiator family protein [Deltaproteobacteria bacterium]
MAKVTSFLRSFFALGILAAILGWVLLYGDRGFINYLNLHNEKERLILLKQELRQKNRELLKGVKGLRNDLKYIERTARHELGMVREGEIVYRFKKPLSSDEVRHPDTYPKSLHAAK